jgi:hypothetical protein
MPSQATSNHVLNPCSLPTHAVFHRQLRIMTSKDSRLVQHRTLEATVPAVETLKALLACHTEAVN